MLNKSQDGKLSGPIEISQYRARVAKDSIAQGVYTLLHEILRNSSLRIIFVIILRYFALSKSPGQNFFFRGLTREIRRIFEK